MLYERILKREEINKGWSGDRKFIVTLTDGERYFLRVTPTSKKENCLKNFDLQKKWYSLGIPMPIPYEITEQEEGICAIYQLIDGDILEDCAKTLSKNQRYKLGVEAGKILKKIHSLQVIDAPDWEARFNRKMDRKIDMYLSCEIHYDGAERFIEYINANRHLLKDRPQCYQHGDYHVGNIMLRRESLTVIDFDRYDIGDPWEEFNRIVWTAQAMPELASGMVDGYFDGIPPIEFWRLLALYISSNTLSSVPWAIPFGKQEIGVMLNQAREVLYWYDGMKDVVPSWYKFKGLYTS